MPACTISAKAANCNHPASMKTSGCRVCLISTTLVGYLCCNLSEHQRQQHQQQHHLLQQYTHWHIRCLPEKRNGCHVPSGQLKCKLSGKVTSRCLALHCTALGSPGWQGGHYCDLDASSYGLVYKKVHLRNSNGRSAPIALCCQHSRTATPLNTALSHDTPTGLVRMHC